MDWEKLLSSETLAQREVQPSYFDKYPIEDLEKDYKAIISSAAFRRLQDKTQVFPLDKSDFVRTRLTHSLEVATIARQLGIMITQKKEDRNESALVKAMKNKQVADKIPSALSCAGLLHDIGNPPFGHFGEVVIGEWYEKELGKKEFRYKGTEISELLDDAMKRDLSNFEGNAQALRILSKSRNKEISHEINLTSGVISALVKYPTSSIDFTSHKDPDIRRHKLGYYQAEKVSFMKISKETGTWLGEKNVVRHPLAFLMEAADDIAYSTADLEDAFKKKLFSLEEFIKFFEDKIEKIPDSQWPMRDKSKKLLNNLLERVDKNGHTTEGKLIAFQNWMDYARGWFMYCVAFSFDINYEQIMQGEYSKELLEGTFHEKSVEIFKDAMKEYVYGDPEIVKLELAAKKIIFSLLDDFVHAVIYWQAEEKGKYELSKADKKLCGLIPDNLKEDYKKARTNDEAYDLYLRFMMVNDFISGMTDSYAKNLYQELNAYK